MPRTVQHILSNLEIAPPTGAWEQIASQLDAAYDPQESVIAQKLAGWETPPPSPSWSLIAAALDAPPAKIIRSPFRKLAVAAAIVAVAGIATWYFSNFRNNNNNQAIAINKEGPASNTDHIGDIQTPPPVVATPTDSTNDLPKPNFLRPSSGKAMNGEQDYASQDAGADYSSEDLNYSGAHTIPAQDIAPPVSVPAPPIRDASGNIVMDLKLLTSPGNNYVTVTGPNGEQTRISRKFLPMITYLNGSFDNNDYNNTWKKRFREWRDKLLQQASFAPSGTNFLDIMELKELIEEK